MNAIMNEQEVRITVGTREVSGILNRPDNAWLLYVLAHGAGAGMRHRFMQAVSERLAGAGVATLRYQFPYLEAGSKRPDPPGLLEATVRAAVAEGHRLAEGLPLIAGGKSMGGRMTSQAAAGKSGLDDVRGLVFLGFPLHAPGQPNTKRAAHLESVPQPMLFMQGTRDTLADLTLITEVTSGLPLATLHVVEGADHSFDVLKRSGRTAEEVMSEIVDTVSAWARGNLLKA
jgi:predicted alpha/beta-hydrolase family hydrolase